MNYKTTPGKKTIHNLIKEKDVFLTTSEKIYEFVMRHLRGVVLGVGAVFLSVVVWVVCIHQIRAKEESILGVYEQALATPETSLAALEKLRDDYPASQAARLASLTLIRLYGETGVPEKALPLAENLLQTLRPAEISLKPLLLDNLGGLYEIVQNYPRAIQSYQALLEGPSLPDYFKPNILLALGRTQSAGGHPEEAIQIYEDLLRSFPGSYPALLAQGKLADLKGEPAVPPIAPPLIQQTEANVSPGGSPSDEAGPSASENSAADEPAPRD